MKRSAGIAALAMTFALIGLFALQQDAPADDSLEQRVSALETRVTVLEQSASSPVAESAEALPTKAVTPSRPTEYDVEGTGPGLFGPFSLAEGRYRFSFQCDESAGAAILSDKKGATFLVQSEDGRLGESITSIGAHADDLYVEIHCDAHWTYHVALV